MASSAPPPYPWQRFRTGGLDQVALTSGADLAALDQLDPKLWVALACPVKGLALDERTLDLIDTDRDGRIRVPEVQAAVRWAVAQVRAPDCLLQGANGLPLAALREDTEEGKANLACAGRILQFHGRPTASHLSVDDVTAFRHRPDGIDLRGDGVILPAAGETEPVRQALADLVAVTGGQPNAAGTRGVTREQVARCQADFRAWQAWQAAGAGSGVRPAGEATPAVAAAVGAVRGKIDDYFSRCRLAAFDPRALGALNRAEADYQLLAGKDLQANAPEAAAFPLARIEAGRPLPLQDGVNPAWAAALARLQQEALAPLQGSRPLVLTEAEWEQVKAKLAPYEAWLAQIPVTSGPPAAWDRLRAVWAEGAVPAAIHDLLARDAALAPGWRALEALEKLTRLQRDLRALLHNFVNFADFYAPERAAIFQAGTLYLDSRATELCLRVDAPAPLAALCKTYIAYCTCTREGQAPLVIAACFTRGDSDYLGVGRRGLFVDRQGRDWDAVVTSLVDQPISVRQAFWAPYKKLVRFVEEQVAKRAAGAEGASSGRLAGVAEKVVAGEAPRPPEPAKKFDLALVTGIGVALGSIGGFLAAVFGDIVRLGISLPGAVLGLMVLISGPSMLLAWLKLRQRTIGPLLELGGWAINGRVRINLPFGATLTQLAEPPPGSARRLVDPYADSGPNRRARWLIPLLVLSLLEVAALLIFWQKWKQGHFFWERPVAGAEARP